MFSFAAVSLDIGENLIVIFLQPILLVLGSFGSSLNLWLFSRARFRSNSCSVYFFASSIHAFIFLFIGIVPGFYSAVTSTNPFTTNKASCKSRSYISIVTLMSCRWLLVMACIDRCFSCSNKINFQSLSNVRMARRISLFVCGFWMIFSVYVLFSVDLLGIRQVACAFPNASMSIFHSLHSILMGATFPSMILILCSVHLWRKIQQKFNRISVDQQNRQNFKRDQQILLILLSQIFIFTISNIPFVLNTFYLALMRRNVEQSDDVSKTEILIRIITEFLLYIFPSSLFYCSTLISRKFRGEFRKLIQSKFCHRNRANRRINPRPVVQLEPILPSLINQRCFHRPVISSVLN